MSFRNIFSYSCKQTEYYLFATLVTRKRISIVKEEIAERLHNYEQLAEETKMANLRLEVIKDVEKM